MIRAREVNHGIGLGVGTRFQYSSETCRHPPELSTHRWRTIGKQIQPTTSLAYLQATVSVDTILHCELPVREQKVRDLPTTACVLSLCHLLGQP
jgi:hypothetical protein